MQFSVSFSDSLVPQKLIFHFLAVTTLLISCISGVIVTFVTQTYLIVLFYSVFIAFAGINVGIINAAAVDLFPTHLRAMAVCVSMMFGRLGSALSSNFIGSLVESNCEMTYYLYAAIMFLCLVVSFALRT